MEKDILGHLLRPHIAGWWRTEGIWWLLAITLTHVVRIAYIRANSYTPGSDYVYVPFVSDELLMLLGAYVWVLAASSAVARVEAMQRVQLTGILMPRQISLCFRAGIPVLIFQLFLALFLAIVRFAEYYRAQGLLVFSAQVLPSMLEGTQLLVAAAWLVCVGVLGGSWKMVRLSILTLIGVSIFGSAVQLIILPHLPPQLVPTFQSPRPYPDDYRLVAWIVGLGVLCGLLFLLSSSRFSKLVSQRVTVTFLILPPLLTIGGLILSTVGITEIDQAPLPFDAIRPLDTLLYALYQPPLHEYQLYEVISKFGLGPGPGKHHWWLGLNLIHLLLATTSAVTGMAILEFAKQVANRGRTSELDPHPSRA